MFANKTCCLPYNLFMAEIKKKIDLHFWNKMKGILTDISVIIISKIIFQVQMRKLTVL